MISFLKAKKQERERENESESDEAFLFECDINR